MQSKDIHMNISALTLFKVKLILKADSRIYIHWPINSSEKSITWKQNMQLKMATMNLLYLIPL